MRDDLVLRGGGRLPPPPIPLCALSAQFPAQCGPGGGRPAGVMAAAGIIFYSLIHGLVATRRIVPDWVVETMVAAGVLIYASVGLAGILLGGHCLDYSVLSSDPIHGQHRGIFWVEVGVAVTVCGVMLKIYYMFASRGGAED